MVATGYMYTLFHHHPFPNIRVADLTAAATSTLSAKLDHQSRTDVDTPASRTRTRTTLSGTGYWRRYNNSNNNDFVVRPLLFRRVFLLLLLLVLFKKTHVYRLPSRNHFTIRKFCGFLLIFGLIPFRFT